MASAISRGIELLVSGESGLWQIVLLSVTVSIAALMLAATLGIPLGAWLGQRRLRGQAWLVTLIYTGMGLPPVVVGLLVYLMLSRQGPLAPLGWLFTPPAMVLAQVILALPLITGVTMSAVRTASADLAPQLRSLGATDRQILATTVREARHGVVVGVMAGFGAAISEVGAVMLVGGNIEGRTRVLTTAIVLETRRGNFDVALALGLVLLLLAFVVNAVAVYVQTERRHARRFPPPTAS
ncbi:ABC transporter permease [soil metagenome]